VPDYVQFYLYFSDEATAKQAAEHLRGWAYEVEVRLGADERNWLALAKKAVSDEELDEAEEQLGEYAASLGGEFDGYDRPPRSL
jgi:hypothetical protein